MRETKLIVRTLKQLLKSHHIRYRDIAKHLNLSEASIKRLFGQEDLTLSRLEQILSLIDMRLVDLLEMLEEQSDYISQLSPEQEVSLIQDTKLLLIFFLLLNAWSLKEIQSNFTININEMTQLLTKLDKLKLIELLPNNRVKLLTANNFSWRKNGPVQKFFEDQVLKNFFADNFSCPSSKMLFLGGMLSEASMEKLKAMVENFGAEINFMFKEDLKLPLEKRFSSGIVLAMRQWEFGIFSQLRRK